MEGSPREKFIQTLIRYQQQFGPERAEGIQQKFSSLREGILAANEGELEWFPTWKRNQIVESLLEKTYQDLIAEMEKEGLS